VLTVVPGVFDQRDRHLGVLHQLAAHRAGRFAAAVMHEHDFVPALDGQTFDFTHDPADRFSTVIQGYDEAQSRTSHLP
jgi:hypothetical protein